MGPSLRAAAILVGGLVYWFAFWLARGNSTSVGGIALAVFLAAPIFSVAAVVESDGGFGPRPRRMFIVCVVAGALETVVLIWGGYLAIAVWPINLIALLTVAIVGAESGGRRVSRRV
ncbi:MAG TPA: hypothetical protein VHD91_00430 [Gaiellaceae bacterium]|nr:hypothetical protein [Gaiellaceae bacterium]